MKEEMTSCGRRSAGPERRLILVAWSFEDARRPLDMKAGHERPRKDRRRGPCDTYVSGAMGEMTSSEQRSAGPGRELILVARSFEDARRPLDVQGGHERPHKDRRPRSFDNHVSGVMGEMTRRARRSAGPGRRFILVARSFKSTRRPLDMKAGHERPHKDRRLGSCDTHVSGAMAEMTSCGRRSAGP